MLHYLSEKIHKILNHAPHAEHWGFVMYALCEVVNAHHVIYYVSVYLFMTGASAILVEIKKIGD